MSDEGWFDPWSTPNTPATEAREQLAREQPEVAEKIANVVRFRRRVLAEFDLLLVQNVMA